MKKTGKQISIRLNGKIMDWVERQAKKENRTKNNFIETVLKERMESDEN